MTRQSPPIVPERGVPLTAETVGLLQPGDWVTHKDFGPFRYERDPFAKWDGYRFLGRPDADGWITHDGGENPAPGLAVEVKIRWRMGDPSEGAVCSDEMRWDHVPSGQGDGGDIIAWRPHVATAPALSTAETVVVPVEDWRHVIGALKNAKVRLPMGAAVGNVSDALSKVEHLTPSAAPACEPVGGAVEELATQLARSISGLGYPVGLGQAPSEADCTKAARAIITLYGAALTPKEAPAATVEGPPREPTQTMMDALLYHSSKDTSWADAYTMWTAAHDTWFRDGADAASIAPAATGAGEDWKREDYGNSTLLYTLKQQGWRKGEPVLVNDKTVRIEFDGDREPVIAAILAALRAQPQAREEAQPVAWMMRERDGHTWAYSCDAEDARLAQADGFQCRPLYTTPPSQPLAEGADAEKLRVAVEAIWEIAGGRATDGFNKNGRLSRIKEHAAEALAALQQGERA